MIKMKIFKAKYFKVLPDKSYIKLKYYVNFHRRLNLKNPETFNEKLQWLKLYDRKDIYTTMVDKYAAKKYMANIIGEKYIVPSLGVYNNFDEIEFNKLPNEFVIKCNHGCGGLVIVENKNDLNIVETRKYIEKHLKTDYYSEHREWPYKNVERKVFIEPLLKNSDGSDLIEYNLFCFDGEPKIIMTCHGDKRIKRYNDFYDMDFKKLDLKCSYDCSDMVEDRPEKLDEMIEISRKLSKDIPYLRVDFFLVNGEVKMGELTFFHWSGYGKFSPKEWDYKLGKYINLPKIEKK